MYGRVEQPPLQIGIRRSGLRACALRTRCMRICAPFSCGLAENPLVYNPKFSPPCVEAIQSVSAIRSTLRTVVTSDRVKQAVPPKKLSKLTVNAIAPHVRKALEVKHIATEVVDDRQRVEVDAVARPKWASEIKGPQLVGCRRLQGRCAEVLPMSTRTLSDAPVSRQDVEDRAACRPLRPGILDLQSLQDLLPGPAVARVFCEDQHNCHRGRLAQPSA